MRIYLATDHAGFGLKEKIKKYLQDLNYQVQDFGALQYNPEDDYPDFINQVAEVISKERFVSSGAEQSRGIILGASGQGEAISANRFPGARAVVCDDDQNMEVKIKSWREHNDSNILSLGAKYLDEDIAIRVVKMWLETTFSGEPRHIRRINKIDKVN